MACGLGHTLALLSSGEVYAWGNGANGRLGLGNSDDEALPKALNSFHDAPVNHVFAGASHSMAVTASGVAYAWGKNNQGQCGVGSTTDQIHPAPLVYFKDSESIVVQMCGGWEHSLALTQEGKVFSFGCGYKDSRRSTIPSVLGHGSTERQIFPLQIAALGHEKIKHIACGWDHSLAVTISGDLYSWGSGLNGKLGHGDEESCSLPTRVTGISDIYTAEAGCEHTAAITTEGHLWTWGHGDSGRLGVGDMNSRNVPTLVEELKDVKVSLLAVGDKYNLMLVQNEDTPVPAKEGVLMKNMSLGYADPTQRVTELNFMWIQNRLSMDPSQNNAMSLSFGKASSALWILMHLERLSSSYSNSSPHLDLTCIQNETITSLQAPYAIDCDPRVFHFLCTLLESFGVQAVSHSSSTATASPTQLADALFQSEGTSGSVTEKSLTAQVLRVSIVWLTLRIIRANLSFYLQLFKEFGQNSTTSLDIKKLHTALTTLVDVPLFKSDDYEESWGFESKSSLLNCTTEIQNCAADVLYIGFDVFYAKASDRQELLWGIVQNASMNPLLVQVCTTRLIQVG